MNHLCGARACSPHPRRLLLSNAPKVLWPAGLPQALAPKRSTIAPDIPTVAEAADLPDYAATAWMGLFAPKDSPDEVVERLSADIQKALEQEKVQTRIKALAAEPLYASADEFGSLVAQEAKQWQAVIEAIGN